MRTFHQSAHSLAQIQSVRVLAKIIEMLLHGRVRLSLRMLEEGLFEATVTQFTSQAVQAGEELTTDRDHPIEQRMKGFVGTCELAARLRQSALQQPENGSNLLLGFLVRFIDPEQDLFQFRRAVEIGDAIMCHCALQPLDELS